MVLTQTKPPPRRHRADPSPAPPSPTRLLLAPRGRDVQVRAAVQRRQRLRHGRGRGEGIRVRQQRSHGPAVRQLRPARVGGEEELRAGGRKVARQQPVASRGPGHCAAERRLPARPRRSTHSCTGVCSHVCAHSRICLTSAPHLRHICPTSAPTATSAPHLHPQTRLCHICAHIRARACTHTRTHACLRAHTRALLTPAPASLLTPAPQPRPAHACPPTRVPQTSTPACAQRSSCARRPPARPTGCCRRCRQGRPGPAPRPSSSSPGAWPSAARPSARPPPAAPAPGRRRPVPPPSPCLRGRGVTAAAMRPLPPCVSPGPLTHSAAAGVREHAVPLGCQEPADHLLPHPLAVDAQRQHAQPVLVVTGERVPVPPGAWGRGVASPAAPRRHAAGAWAGAALTGPVLLQVELQPGHQHAVGTRLGRGAGGPQPQQVQRQPPRLRPRCHPASCHVSARRGWDPRAMPGGCHPAGRGDRPWGTRARTCRARHRRCPAAGGHGAQRGGGRPPAGSCGDGVSTGTGDVPRGTRGGELVSPPGTYRP